MNTQKKYTAAVIGVGKANSTGGEKGGGHSIGYGHAETYGRHPRVELAACADINSENLSAFVERFKVPHGFDDYRRMLQEIKPDIVSVATYVGLHYPMIEAAARAGVKGVLCEKPFLNSPSEILKLRRLIEETGVKIAVAHTRRFQPDFARAKELYCSGAVGEPLMCMAGIQDWDLSEWGAHWLDMFRFFHNDAPVKYVMAQARVRDFRGYGHAMEEHAVAYFEFEGGGRAVLDGGRKLNSPDLSLTLVGTQGVIHSYIEGRLVVQDASGEREENFADHPMAGYMPIWDAMLDGLITEIEGGAPSMLGAENMMKTSELNLAAYISCLRGDRVDLPLDDATLAEYSEWPVEELARRAQNKIQVGKENQ